MARSKKAQAAIDDALALQFSAGKVGLGIDLVEIDRVRRILSRTPAFSTRMFSEAERAYCDSKPDPATHYAARFAAKEAVVKALGTGFTQGITVRDIEVCIGKGGKPEVKLSGQALLIAEENGVIEMPLSLSHTRKDAIACALAITKASLDAKAARVDPAAELAKRFKETRAILDDLGSAERIQGN